MQTTYLDHSETALEQNGGYWTAKEICQQPESWTKTFSTLKNQRQEIDDFLTPILQTNRIRIILTGAGTSAFIGNSVVSSVSTHLTANPTYQDDIRVEAIATTDLVSNPHEYFQKSIPTLLVSFARSGNSPESIAAVEYAEKLIDNCYQLAITCNEEGELYKYCQNENRLSLLMPEETNDKSLAMTSSFSSMLLSALYVFCNTEHFEAQLNKAVKSTKTLIEKDSAQLKNMASYNYDRVIYLGSGVFKGLAQESALKLLELTDGKIISSFDSPLGFRHGPKAIINKDTLVILFTSNQSHTRKSDIDLLKELQSESNIGAVIALSALEIDLPETDPFKIDDMQEVEDIFLLFPYITYAQMYAFQRSVSLGNSPDNPSSSGTINRVVQGVTIHAL